VFVNFTDNANVWPFSDVILDVSLTDFSNNSLQIYVVLNASLSPSPSLVFTPKYVNFLAPK
jgi:hypothetical protein